MSGAGRSHDPNGDLTLLTDGDWARAALASEQAPWRHYTFPGKAPNRFAEQAHQGKLALAVQSRASLSVIRKALDIEPTRIGSLRFSWAADAPTPVANVGVREQDDSPLRIVLTFEGDRSSFSARNAALSELAQALTGEPMPYATLMYLWCPGRDVGEVVVNPRTDRIRSIVVRSGATGANQWQSVERDIGADYVHAFGEPPGRLSGVGLMTDTDNTQTETRAWYGPMDLRRRG